jgi:NADH-quinone oxidoreductase subunit D
MVQIRLKEYNDLFTFNHAFLKRTSDIGVITPSLVTKFGVTGPSARGSGSTFDVRKAHPYSGYDRIDFEVAREAEANGGGAHSRFLVHLREISQSVAILRQATERMPSGDFSIAKIEKEFRVPEGEAYSRIESARGLLGCHVVSDGSSNPSRVQFRTPSSVHLMLIPELLEGIRIEDLPVLLASLDLGIGEADR